MRKDYINILYGPVYYVHEGAYPRPFVFDDYGDSFGSTNVQLNDIDIRNRHHYRTF